MLKVISLSLIIYNIYYCFKAFKKHPSFIKHVYFTNLKDYISAFFLVLMAFTLLILCKLIQLPYFLTFSWLNLFGFEGTNLLVFPFLADSSSVQTASKEASSLFLGFLFILIFYVVLISISAFVARNEERVFRSYNLSTKERIKYSFLFGFYHMIVGVPVNVALILTLVGWILSVRYYNAFIKKSIEEKPNEGWINWDAHHYALERSTSLHAKYNFIIITASCLTIAISLFV